jgi:hypothetical protein
VAKILASIKSFVQIAVAPLLWMLLVCLTALELDRVHFLNLAPSLRMSFLQAAKLVAVLIALYVVGRGIGWIWRTTHKQVTLKKSRAQTEQLIKSLPEVEAVHLLICYLQETPLFTLPRSMSGPAQSLVKKGAAVPDSSLGSQNTYRLEDDVWAVVNDLCRRMPPELVEELEQDMSHLDKLMDSIPWRS